MLAWLTGWPAFAHTLLTGLSTFALSTPDLTTLPAVRTLWDATLGVSAGFALLLLLASAGTGVLPAPLVGLVPLPIRQLAVRLAAAVLLATQSLTLTGWLVAFNNALIGAVTHQANLLGDLRDPAPAGGLLVVLVTLLPYMALLIALAVIYAIRIAELLVLTVLAPVAAVFLIHPGTQRLTALWAGELVAVTFLQCAQAVLLELFQVVAITLPRSEGTVAALASTLALLVLTIRLPGWMSGFVHSIGNSTVGAWIGRAAVRSF